MKLRVSGRSARKAAVISLAFLAAPLFLYAQLVLENPLGRWRAGETVELVLREPSIQQGTRIDAVLFDGRPVQFELLEPEAEGEALRIRLRIPSSSKPGDHGISVLLSDAPSTAPAPIAVPEILDLAIDEARRTLEERGLELVTGSFQAIPSDAVVHTVVRQDPAAGTMARRGARVAVEIASLTEVPDIVGLTIDEARRELGERALELDTGSTPVALTPSSSGAWKVQQQAPESGTQVPTGTRVTVEMGLEVPDLVGTGIDRVRPILLAE